MLETGVPGTVRSLLLLVIVLPALVLGPASMSALAEEKSDSRRDAHPRREQPRSAPATPDRRSDDAARRAREDADRRARENSDRRARDDADRRARAHAQQQRDAEDRNRRRDAEERNRRRDAEERNRQRAAQQPERSAGQTRQRPKQQDRERWEADQIRRHQDRLRDEDQKRISASRSSPAPAAPAVTTPAAPVRSSAVSCSARPACPTAAGSGNVCRGVQQTYADTGTGMPDIASRCRSANLPDPCGIDVAGDMSEVRSFRVRYGGGCAQQCVNVAVCQAASR